MSEGAPELAQLREHVRELQRECERLEAALAAGERVLNILSGRDATAPAEQSVPLPEPFKATWYHWPGALILSTLMMTVAYVVADGLGSPWPYAVAGLLSAMLLGYILAFPSKLSMTAQGLMVRNQHYPPVNMTWEGIEDIAFGDGSSGTPRVSVRRNGSWTEIGGPRARGGAAAAARRWVAYAQSLAARPRVAVPQRIEDTRDAQLAEAHVAEAELAAEEKQTR